MYQIKDSLRVGEQIYKTDINGLWFIKHELKTDERGFFKEISVLSDLEEVTGFEFIIKQVNLARSNTNVARGIHMEDWNKLITIIRGSVFCAIADLRPDSSTYKKVTTFNLGDEDEDLSGSLFISKGLGNSMCVTKGPVDYLYLVDKLYRERNVIDDKAFSLFDPVLNIPWPIPKNQMVISKRDSQAGML